MTAPAIQFATTGRGSVNQTAKLLIEAAGRGDVEVRRERRWDVYLLNGVERPEVRPLLVKLLADRVLEVQDPDAVLSLIVPAGDVR